MEPPHGSTSYLHGPPPESDIYLKLTRKSRYFSFEYLSIFVLRVFADHWDDELFADRT